jgi:predicted P-loop ATPase
MGETIKLSPRTRREIEHDQTTLDTDGLLKSDKGAVKPCEHNARVLIASAPQYHPLHFDEYLSRMRVDKRDWTDADDIECLCWLQSANAVSRFTIGQTRNAARAVAYSRRRDSLRQFIEALPAWDGVERVEHAFTDAWGAPDTDLIRAGSRNFFVALIARALRPGAQVDTLWTFEGPQGSFKSRALRALGGDFHAEITAPVGTTDFMRELRGVWLAEMSELDSLRGREASTVKRLLSAPADRFVQKYALHAESYPRRAVAVATTNEAAYWQDSTGARRLIPIPCGEIRCDLIADNRLQWFAEARHAHANGASWWEFPVGIADAQEARQHVEPWEDTLRDAMAHGRRSGFDEQGVVPWPQGPIASAEIMRDWLRLEPHQQGQASSTRLGKVMRRLGYAPARIGHERARGWQRADTQQAASDEVSSEVSA